MPSSPRRPLVPFIERICGLALRPFQRDFLEELALEADGRRVHTLALWGLPRGNGKTEVAAAVALHQLVADGRPLADRNPPQVIIAAGSREQAAIAFQSARRMAEASPALERALHVLPGRKVIVHPQTDGELRIVSREGPLQHGLRPTAVIFDELWNQPDRDLWDALVGGLIKVEDPLLLCISTAGFDRASLLAELCERGESGEDPRFLYRWHGLPAESPLDYRDPVTWREANPAMSCDPPFLMESGIADSLTRMRENEFRRWHLNQWTQAEQEWLPFGAWDDCHQDFEPSGDVCLAFSGTYNSASAALIGCTSGGQVFTLGVWEAPAGLRVSHDETNTAVAAAMRKYDVRHLAVNPPGWDSDAEGWAEDYGETVVIEWPVRKRARFADACHRFLTGVLTGTLTQDGDARLARHIANARPKQVPEGQYIVDVEDAPATAAKAAVLAYEQATAEEAEPSIRILGVD